MWYSPAMLSINAPDIKKLERDLKTFANRALPFATKATVNGAAFSAMRIARADVREDMVVRNQFTVRSIQVEQARTLRIPRQEAIVGSVADYMEVQEFGGIKAKKGKEGVAIATSYSAGQGQNAQPRTRLPRKANALQAVQLKKSRGRGTSRKQRNLIAIREAATSGRKFVFLDLGRRKGIFRVTGSKKRAKIKMIHDLSSTSVSIPRNPWLKPAVDLAALNIPFLYRKALRFQARRHGLFDGR